MNEWMNEWVNEWMNAWMNEWMNEPIEHCYGWGNCVTYQLPLETWKHQNCKFMKVAMFNCSFVLRSIHCLKAQRSSRKCDVIGVQNKLTLHTNTITLFITIPQLKTHYTLSTCLQACFNPDKNFCVYYKSLYTFGFVWVWCMWEVTLHISICPVK